MALMPKRVKYRKAQRGMVRGYATRGNHVVFGDYGLQALSPGWLSARQLEAGRVTANHYLGGEGRIYIRVFPSKPVSARPAETRMGKGKGEVAFWAAVVKPGTILFEVGGVPEDVAKMALLRTAHKMPIPCRFARRKAM